MRLLLLCAALAATPTFAGELVARQGNDMIRLADAACTTQSVLSRLAPGMRGQFKAASAVVDGRTFAACWRMLPAGAHVIYEDGDQGLVPLSDLKPQLTA